LQVASSLRSWGGIERYVAYLARGLASRGCRVAVACPDDSPLASRVSDHVSVEMRGKLDVRAFAAYLRLFRAEKFDVVHAHFSPDFLLPAYAARLTRQPMTVMTRHLAVRWHPAKARLYARLWRRIIPVSHAVERRLVEAGIPASQMTVAKAGVPPPEVRSSRADVRRGLGIGDAEFAVGSFGRLAPEKGIEVLVDAAARLSGVRVCIFGSGPEEAALRARASSDAVSFHGQISDVGDAMNAMDAVVIPSTWEESFPYSALEAMALGRPIVASRIGGLPEMVADGVNGSLFTPGNANELAQTLDTHRLDPDRCAAMGRSGYARYLAEFTVDHMVDRIMAVYSPK
jgi:glycosyltransferase involved in cell wall biosynthesis